jgi:hypothetical protein
MKEETSRNYSEYIDYPTKEIMNRIQIDPSQPSTGYGFGYKKGEEPKKRELDMSKIEELARLTSPFLDRKLSN